MSTVEIMGIALILQGLALISMAIDCRWISYRMLEMQAMLGEMRDNYEDWHSLVDLSLPEEHQ
jgi:hypothetical protein